MNPGVTAVVVFYLLAGHVVSHLWDNVLPGEGFRLGWFYRDRLLRIMPLYLYVITLTLVFLMITGYGDPAYSLVRIIGNLLVVPVNYYMVLDTTILTDPSWALIPVAWSLGAELQAYVFLPLILQSRQWKCLLIGGSFGVYMLANLGVIHPDYFGYRLIFGVFFIFAAGACIQRTRERCRHLSDRIDRMFPWILWLVIISLFWTFSTAGWFGPGYTRETFLGLILGIPLVFFGSRTRVTLKYNALLGSLSYGVFLAHFMVIWWLDDMEMTETGSIANVLTVTLLSTLIAYIGVRFLEDPVDRVRKYGKKLALFHGSGKFVV
jgi:peptidoglycan/LPS O-acetylase OafA/YrhL